VPGGGAAALPTLPALPMRERPSAAREAAAATPLPLPALPPDVASDAGGCGCCCARERLLARLPPVLASAAAGAGS